MPTSIGDVERGLEVQAKLEASAREEREALAVLYESYVARNCVEFAAIQCAALKAKGRRFEPEDAEAAAAAYKRLGRVLRRLS